MGEFSKFLDPAREPAEPVAGVTGVFRGDRSRRHFQRGVPVRAAEQFARHLARVVERLSQFHTGFVEQVPPAFHFLHAHRPRALPGIAQCGGAFDGFGDSAADPDRHTRGVLRAQADADIVEGDVCAVERHRLAGQQQAHRLDVFAKARHTGFAFDAHRGELGVAVAEADAENEFAVRQMIQRGGFLGQQHGIEHRQQQHRGPHPHPARQTRQIAHHRRGGELAHVRSGDEMLRKPERVEPRVTGGAHLVRDVGEMRPRVEAGFGFKGDEQTGFHEGFLWFLARFWKVRTCRCVRERFYHGGREEPRRRTEKHSLRRRRRDGTFRRLSTVLRLRASPWFSVSSVVKAFLMFPSAMPRGGRITKNHVF